MALNLDTRQRAMLEEMHVRVWWPTHAPEADAGPAAQDFSPTQPAAQRAGAQLPGAGADATAAPAATTLPTARSAPPAVPAPAPQPQEPPAIGGAGASPAGWPALVPRVAECQACGLCAGRRAPVLRPAVLPAQRDWMVVGEPPNEDEERAGEAFAADAGKLLDNMLRAVGVSRRAEGAQGAWATNVVKCRPAIARIPQNDELLQCRAHLDAEIALVRPRVILAMGRFATLSLLGPDNPALSGRPFGQLRGSVHSHAGVPVVVMQHPERLLRQPAQKAEAWVDLCRAMEIVRSG